MISAIIYLDVQAQFIIERSHYNG